LFLQELLDSGSHKYGTFGSHRAALSLLLPGDIGADPVLSRFLKGVSRSRPPAPRYTVTWDPSPVLRFLEQMDTPNLKTLSKKLTTLLVLATGQRLQTISLIRLSGLQQSKSGLRIFIKDCLKTSGIKKNQPVLSIPYFQEKPKLCVATTILHYVNMTASMRQEEDFLFLTTTKPHSAASKQTISRWVKDTLQMAGVDVAQFKPHSTRHASTSSAHRLGISIDQIKQCAGWSPNSETFARFYNRPVVEPGQYITKILSSAT
jgi:integrase